MDHLRHQKYKNKRLENNFKTINISINDMDKFEKKELTKKRTFTKNIWYDWYNWLIKYIPEPLKKSVGRVKDQIMSLFKTKDYSKPVKTVNGRGKKESEENIIKNIRNLFKPKKRKKLKIEIIFSNNFFRNI